MYVLDTNTLIYFFKGQGQVAETTLIAGTALANQGALVTRNTGGAILLPLPLSLYS